jgi:hypothetical protein
LLIEAKCIFLAISHLKYASNTSQYDTIKH